MVGRPAICGPMTIPISFELFTGSHKQPTTSKNALLIFLVYFF
jgi:hypothetical protein